MRIQGEVRKETIIQKSRFIACINRAFSEEEARAYIEQIRKEYADASHVCTAYIIGQHKEIQRSSDNKEPSGTAGVPMLESLLHNDVYDIVACVVRYFGGIKLGAGGLIRAYSGSVTSALQEATKTIDVIFHIYEVTYPYDLSGSIENWIRKNCTILNLDYGEQVTCRFESDRDDIEKTIQDLSSGSIKAKWIQDEAHEKAI